MPAVPEPGAGDVAITLDGEEQFLRPTAEACMAISRMGGGLVAAIQKCRNLDFDAIVDIISIGLGVNPGQKAKIIIPAVFRSGTMHLAADCILFIRTIANGGILPKDDGEEDETDPPLAGSESPSQNSTAP